MPHRNTGVALILGIMVPALRAISVTTTLLVVVLAFVAMWNGCSLSELYLTYFPEVGHTTVPTFLYAAFVTYIVGASEAAILFRRSVTARPRRRRPRPFGLATGTFVVPDDFDDPLPEDVLRDFEQ